MVKVPDSMIGDVTVKDLVVKYVGHSMEIIKSVLRAYYLRPYNESLDFCVFMFESAQVELEMNQKVLLNCVTAYYTDLRDIICELYGRDSNELIIYDCYRDLYDTRDVWSTNELYETLPERPDVNLIKAMGWEEEFVK